MPPLHPDLAELEFLLGTWAGAGRGEYPTIDSFEYQEEVTFSHVGKPFIAYAQRTRSSSQPPAPLHAETGYWRFPARGRVELVLSHPTGVTEVDEGTIEHTDDGAVIELATTAISLTSTAKQVTALTRRFEIRGDVLTYQLAMAAVGQPLQHHLAAELHRTTSD